MHLIAISVGDGLAVRDACRSSALTLQAPVTDVATADCYPPRRSYANQLKYSILSACSRNNSTCTRYLYIYIYCSERHVLPTRTSTHVCFMLMMYSKHSAHAPNMCVDRGPKSVRPSVRPTSPGQPPGQIDNISSATINRHRCRGVFRQ